MTDAAPRVVIVGGGFGGTHAAHALRHAAVRVTLIDRTNHSVFHPLLYQVATAGLSSDEIAAPIRFLLRRQLNTEVLLAEVKQIDPMRHRVSIGSQELSYDYLILATGSEYDYFNHPDWARYAPSIKTIADATLIRHRILQAFERAELESDPNEIRSLLTFVIIGGGPTGVELAGALSELTRHVLAREYRHIDTRNSKILLLEAAPRILHGFTEELSRKAEKELARKGVEVRTAATVTSVDKAGVLVNRNEHIERIRSCNVLWTAGVKATPLGRTLDAETDQLGRVKVLPDLSVPGHPEVFVIGDLAVLEQHGRPFAPGLAPVAMQQGKYVGELIAKRVLGRKTPRPFRYRDRGKLATIGRGFAVAEFGRIRIGGRLGWLLWSTVHILYLAGLWNRLQVFLTWVWAYITYQRSVRIIAPDALAYELGALSPHNSPATASDTASQEADRDEQHRHSI
jgi:NADH dehydrogenase